MGGFLPVPGTCNLVNAELNRWVYTDIKQNLFSDDIGRLSWRKSDLKHLRM